MRASRGVLALLVLLSALSCRGRPAALSPSTIPVDPDRCTILGEAQGSAWGCVILLIPISTKQAPLARDRAIESVPGADGLLEASVSYTVYPFFLMNFTKATVRGKAFQIAGS